MCPKPAVRMTAIRDDDWLYQRNEDNSARFVLGTPGENPLVCFGINPSTAAPNRLDRTVSRVARAASESGHDSFVMLNVYAQRATNPRDLHRALQPGLMQENERHIADLVRGRSLTLWAAWGTNIGTRPYLASCLAGIVALPELSGCTWVSRGPVTKHGHPRHPLYVANGTLFDLFDIERYRLDIDRTAGQ